MSAENDQNELIAEARVARQEELIKLLKAQGRDTSEAKSMLAGMTYSLKVIRQQRERQRHFAMGRRGPAQIRTSA
jgi:arginine repressor